MRDIMKTINILIPMHLAGQDKRCYGGQAGYAMAALLVGLSIMAVMFTVVMPVWKQTAQREKEEELVFRGKQYAHAIGMFQRKFANTYPPNIDVLVDQRFLRKKFKDPITNDDFVPIPAGQPVPGTQAPGAQRGAPSAAGPTNPGGNPGGRGQTTPAQTTQPGAAGRVGGPPVSTGSVGQTSGGIQGVTSKSKDQSIRLYNGRGHYNEWAFVYIQQQQAAGAGAAGTATPGPGGQRGQPGQPPGPIGPGGSQRGRGPGGPNGPGGRGSNGGVGTFGGSGTTPVLPPTQRGRF
jgi:type II secretory pathway pseudopilin PulG